MENTNRYTLFCIVYVKLILKFLELCQYNIFTLLRIVAKFFKLNLFNVNTVGYGIFRKQMLIRIKQVAWRIGPWCQSI